MKIDWSDWLSCWWSNECVVIDEWWFQYEVCLIVPVCTRVDRDDCYWLHSYSIFIKTIHNISLHIVIMIWIWIVCVSVIISHSTYLVFIINPILHSYTLSTSPIHINTLNYLHCVCLRDDTVMNGNKRDCIESDVKEMRFSDELFRLLKCMKHCETIWKRYCL